jgi:ligand-binding SRPBCC domain-containing protein
VGKTFTVSDTVHIQAPIERCFLLSTSIELVQRTLGMRPISGKTSGLVEMGDQLVWVGWKFGLPQMHETLITGYRRPDFFQDTMARGRFKTFSHDHSFTEIAGRTLLHDKVRFSMPFGFAGRLVAAKVLVPHIARLMQRRFQLLKKVAEGEEWRRYLE